MIDEGSLVSEGSGAIPVAAPFAFAVEMPARNALLAVMVATAVLGFVTFARGCADFVVPSAGRLFSDAFDDGWLLVLASLPIEAVSLVYLDLILKGRAPDGRGLVTYAFQWDGMYRTLADGSSYWTRWDSIRVVETSKSFAFSSASTTFYIRKARIRPPATAQVLRSELERLGRPIGSQQVRSLTERVLGLWLGIIVGVIVARLLLTVMGQ